MMRIFKTTYADKSTGEAKWCNVFYIEFKDLQGRKRRLSAYTYESRTEILKNKINDLLAAGGSPSRELLQWFEKQPPRIIGRLAEWGLLPNKTVADNLNKTLAENLDDFCGQLQVIRTPQYVKQVKSSLNHIFDECGFKTRADIDGGRIYSLLDQRKKRAKNPISDRTFNYYLKTCRQFFKWMVTHGRAVSNPLDSFACIGNPIKVVQRRVLELDEQCKLLEAADSGPTYHNLTGYQRKLVYALALQTGLRAGEIKSLTVGSFNLDEGRVIVLATNTKNKKEADMKLTAAMTAELKQHFAGKLPTVQAFDFPDQPAKMIQKDLEAAGIPYKTDKGQADFHSLRHSFITGLVRRGVMPKDAQVAARHSTIKLTMDVYAHAREETQDKIMEQQPDILNLRHA
jgi:integrase